MVFETFREPFNCGGVLSAMRRVINATVMNDTGRGVAQLSTRAVHSTLEEHRDNLRRWISRHVGLAGIMGLMSICSRLINSTLETTM